MEELKIEHKWFIEKQDYGLHHEKYLWKNGNIWWIRFTLTRDDKRVSKMHRYSLKTMNKAVAIRRRDRILKQIEEKYS